MRSRHTQWLASLLRLKLLQRVLSLVTVAIDWLPVIEEQHEFDYILTLYSNPLTKTNQQNNFRYCGGIILKF